MSDRYDNHRRNEERAQGVPCAPPIRSKIGTISNKIKFRSKGAELFWAPPIL